MAANQGRDQFEKWLDNSSQGENEENGFKLQNLESSLTIDRKNEKSENDEESGIARISGHS